MKKGEEDIFESSKPIFFFNKKINLVRKTLFRDQFLFSVFLPFFSFRTIGDPK